MLSGSLRALTESRRRVLPTKTSANKKLKMQNTFEALQESGELIKDATADEQLERTSSKDPGAWPCPDSALLSECRSAAPGAPVQKAGKRRWKTVTDDLLCQLSEEDESWPSLDKASCSNECGSCWAFRSSNQLNVLIEKRTQSLMPLSGTDEWEYLEFILDSGATATVIPPNVGKAYDIQPGDASRAGVTYEVANGEEIPNLGEKLMPVVTAEGTWRGMRAQVADVSKALQSVRTLVRAGHMVVFGDGDDGDGNYIVNKITGEFTSVKDDGTNYLLGLYIAPRSEAGFPRPDQ